MKGSRLDRASLFSGVLAVIFLIVGGALVGLTEFLPSAQSAHEQITENASQVLLGGYIGAIAAFFLIWFAGSLRSVLAQDEGGTARLANTAYGGGIGASVAIAMGYTVIIVAALRADAEGGISEIAAVTYYDLWGQILGYANGILLAVFVAATAAVSLRTKLFPSWFGWLSILVAIGLLTPYNYIFNILTIAWIFVVSLWLFIRFETEQDTSEA